MRVSVYGRSAASIQRHNRDHDDRVHGRENNGQKNERHDLNVEASQQSVWSAGAAIRSMLIIAPFVMVEDFDLDERSLSWN
jgi:hypothetical protein